jgi:hypothetical protein
MANLDQIRFQKLSIEKFTELDKKDLVKELKKRNIACRLTDKAVLFDERFLKDVKDLIPASLR